MPTKPKAILWIPLMAAVAASASPVAFNMGSSRVDIAVTATIDSFVAKLQAFEVSATAEPRSGRIDTAVFRCKFDSIRTGDAGRDRDMNEWQQTSSFPDVVFTLAALETDVSGRSVARGRLRFHGMERSVGFPISIATSGRSIAVDGEVSIDTRDYGLPVISKYLILKVDPTVHLRFHLQGIVSGP